MLAAIFVDVPLCQTDLKTLIIRTASTTFYYDISSCVHILLKLELTL